MGPSRPFPLDVSLICRVCPAKNVAMHQHLAHPPAPEPSTSLLDNISDTLLNAFSKVCTDILGTLVLYLWLIQFGQVRKPDERFIEIKESLDKFEESLNAVERLQGRARARTTGTFRCLSLPRPLLIQLVCVSTDLSSDYEDFAASIQGLGYLESGITEPLQRFDAVLLEFSQSLKEMVVSHPFRTCRPEVDGRGYS
jgi:sorting nexin-4